MAFWSRLRQSQLKTLSYQIKKYHLFNTLNHTPIQTRIGAVNNQNISQFHFPNNVRFFAAPVQAKKKEEKDTGGPRLNDKIIAHDVRLILSEKEKDHRVMSLSEALNLARRAKLDLVEVDRNGKPPVCKIMDYNKERYLLQVKDKERTKTKSSLAKRGITKEVRFAGQISQNDLQLKADMVKRLLEEGYKVKCLATRKKEEDVGKLLERFAVLVEEFSIVESGPRVDEQNAHMILRHIKLGQAKKGSRKKVVKATKTDNDSGEAEEESDIIAATTVQAPPLVNANRYSRESRNSIDVQTSPPPIKENRYSKEPRNNPIDTVRENRYSKEPRNNPIDVQTPPPVIANRYSREPRNNSINVQSSPPPVKENRYSREPRNNSIDAPPGPVKENRYSRGEPRNSSDAPPPVRGNRYSREPRNTNHSERNSPVSNSNDTEANR